MNRLKVTLYYIIYFIKHNPVKVIFLILTIISSFFIGKFPRDIKTNYVVHSIVDERTNEYVYFCRESSDNYSEYTVEKFDEEITIENGIISYDVYGSLNILFILITSGCFVIGVFAMTEGFDIECVVDDVIRNLIYCEYEDDKYIYMCQGRLLGKSDTNIKYSRILTHFSIYGYKDLMLCPKFKTRTEKRDSNLKKIGIK